jgi:hypothetical protein
MPEDWRVMLALECAQAAREKEVASTGIKHNVANAHWVGIEAALMAIKRVEEMVASGSFPPPQPTADAR